MRTLLSFALAAGLVLGAGAAQAASTVETFDTSPSGWYADRYAPAGFDAPVSFMGDNRLALSISAADSQNGRPGSYSSPFYNTQGMKHDNPAGTVYTAIDMFLSVPDLSTTNRVFGLWGTAFDNADNITSYPIIEYANGGFRGWGPSGWTEYGLPGSIVGDEWVTLAFALNLASDTFNYFVNDIFLGSVAADGAQYIGNTILQGYNTQDGITYTAYLDNLTLSTIPVPAALPLLGTALLGFAGLTGWRRRRGNSAGKAAA